MKWIDVTRQKPQRRSPRALRFANLKVGDQIMRKPQDGWYRKIPTYFVVTDLWYDPVEGQDDPLRGRMVGYAQIGQDGRIGRKQSTTIRGLASQQFVYADIDYAALVATKNAAMAESDGVVPINLAHAIRRRPKLPGAGL